MRYAFTIVLLLVLAVAASAQMRPYEPSATTLPPNLSDVSIHQKLDAQIPPTARFRDSEGKEVTLSQYFGKGKPIILNLVYYECPMLCTEVLNGLTSMLKVLKLNVGSDFDVLTISFDPRETPELAAAKKKAYLQRYNRPGASAGWHFLAGDKENIKAVTDAAGFNYRWDERSQQWAHAAAIMVLTPDGRLAQYFYGIEYPPRDIRLALVQSSQGTIGNLVDEVLLYCYHYDPRTGRYGAVISRVMRLAAAGTMVILGGFLIVMFRRERRYGSNSRSGRAA